MPKTTCNQQLYDGQQSRRNSPLFQGCYKIRETITEFSDMPAEIDRIRGVRMRKVSPGRLRHCTEEDAHVWIRNMPFNVAHSLGRKHLPTLCVKRTSTYCNDARPLHKGWTLRFMMLAAIRCTHVTY